MSINKPTILQIVPALDTGGVERGTVDIALAIQAAGGRALVVSTGGKLVHELVRGNVTHLLIKSIGSKNPFKIIWNAQKLKAIIKAEKVDLVHARSRAPAWAAWLAARSTNVPFVTTFHSPYNYKGRLKRFYNSVMAKGARVIAVSSYTAMRAADHYNVPQSLIRLIYRGVDVAKLSLSAVRPDRYLTLQKFWRVPDDYEIVLLPGRLTRWKGQAVLIEAMASLRDLKLIAVCVGSDQGRTAYRAELDALIAKHDLGAVIRLPGDCTDMPAAYAASAIVVSASTEAEAFGRVIAEAQAMEKPVIVSDIGAVAETARATGGGLVIPPNDAAALAAAIRELYEQGSNARAALGKKARDYVLQHYTKELMCTKTLAVYDELLPVDRQFNLASSQ